MASKLKKYFPIIREREEVLAEIKKSSALQEKFDKWTEDQREEFLNFCKRFYLLILSGLQMKAPC